jgi:hypothetical protein
MLQNSQNMMALSPSNTSLLSMVRLEQIGVAVEDQNGLKIAS